MKYFDMRWRLVYLAIAVGIFLLSFQIGASISLSLEQANNVKNQLSQRNTGLDQMRIFVNNVLPSLEMFIPGAGVVIGAYSAFSTGQALSAFASLYPSVKSIFPLSVFTTSFAILEVIAYGIAMSRSGMLVYYFITERKNLSNSLRKQSIQTAIEIGIVMLILFIGSAIEWQILAERQQKRLVKEPIKTQSM